MLEKQNFGHLHPISLITNRAVEIFEKMGFSVASGPELETEWYNFDALNFDATHPARDMQDTFWIDTKEGEEKKVLRTHTSNVQIRTMQKHIKENKSFPIAVICPGKVFRNEATDATHEANFHQLEGLYVAEKASIAEMKWVLEKFLSELFERNITIRVRSSYFPFVEPGLEVDMSCFKCGGSGCTKCKQSGYIEIMGAGMVHPNVLKFSGIDHSKYSAFAFGIGIDRIAMMLYGIEDIRLLYSGDLRLTSQF